MKKQSEQNPRQNTFIFKTLWFAILWSIGIFFFLAWKLSTDPNFVANENPQTQIFAIVAGVTAALSFALPIFLTPQKEVRSREGEKQPHGGQALFVPFVLRIALTESVGIMGYLTCQQTGKFEDFLAFGISAILLMFIHGLIVSNQIKALGRKSF